ncbi:TonB-dependent receptor [Noviherbaspirillum sp. 17J57-3]|uniref:TonB-dependent receptor n=2 Tax=Noviherbaspirillum galbum TaxID=2709383 RepID=A0A6B3SQV3_9BURK|nr:TonB-dependent receptor [Noviherbaspirillum galbum]
MMETVLARSVRLIFSGGMAVVGVGLLAQPAVAQTTSGSNVQRVEVTGSNIRRAQSETASAVQTLNREDIERSGKTSVAELLQTLAVDNQGSVPTTFGSGFASGASGISLRGLGAASTLVLINGRRVAPYGLADDGQKVFADLNIIPLEAVERVEVLKDGASSIYGSDAIAGVVNVILRKDYQGSTAKVSYGQSRYGDGKDTRLTFTHGMGDLNGPDGFNVLFNFEYGKKGEIWNRDRSDRDQIGRGDLRSLGFSPDTGLAGVGFTTGGGTVASSSSLQGLVRNPTTLNYYNRGYTGADSGFTRTFPGAACGNFPQAARDQALAGNGCIYDAAQQYQQIQPSSQSYNFFTRATKNLGADMQAYGELLYYKNDSTAYTTPSAVSSSVGYPGGPVTNTTVALGAAHPDNPYFGTAARLRYSAWDVGPRVSNVGSTFNRLLGGLKGTNFGWDWDTALLYSENKVSNNRTGYLQRDVAFALLNPSAANVAAARAGSAAYAALPAGSVWRIGENAGLNSAALYAALSPSIGNDAKTQVAQADFKASREFGKLEGGAIGVAVGGEFRHEYTRLDPTAGTDRGNIIGLGYSAYSGQRNVGALYAEVLAPVLKTLELSAAIRGDHYTDVGNSFTPKVGAKWTPIKELAIRGTYAEGFRAPSAAENGVGGLAAFSTASDPARCRLGIASACSPANVALITSPNPALQPEKSKSYSLGVVWDPLPRTSISLDVWQIDRNNEINQESVTSAIAAGRVARDPTSATPTPGDPGPITAVLTNYVNSNNTRVQGADLDLRQGFDLGTNGKLTLDMKWTHLFKWKRTEADGTVFDYAGTHGNCDVTNCIGTPDDRINLGATWERAAWKVSTVVNYRGAIKNINFKDDPAGCANVFANGTDAPSGCKIKSFTTVDLTARYKVRENIEVFGSIQNLFDSVAPLDPLTYGATSYNPLDYSGAVGRFFNVGLKYKF